MQIVMGFLCQKLSCLYEMTAYCAIEVQHYSPDIDNCSISMIFTSFFLANKKVSQMYVR